MRLSDEADEPICRDALLRTIGRVAEHLLTGADWRRGIVDGLASLGRAMAVSRIYIFENETDDGGTIRSSQRHEWTADGVAPEIGNESLQRLPLRAAGFARWEERLGRGEVIQGSIVDFPESERAILEAQQIRTLLVVPIFANGAWWGFMGFDECRREREWSSLEVEALRTAAGILGGAIRHKRTANALQESEERYRRLVEQSPDAIVVRVGDRIRFVNSAAVHLLGLAAREAAVGRSLREFVRPEDVDVLRDQVREMAERGVHEPIEARLCRADGTVAYVESTSVEIQFDGEEASQIVLRDITLRKEAERSAHDLIREQAARTAAETAARRARFLAEAGSILSSSLDYRTTLRSVARLAISSLADSCIVYLVEEGGHARYVEAAHVDPAREQVLLKLLSRDPPDLAAPNSPIARVMSRGEAEIVPRTTEAWLRNGRYDAEQLALCREVRPASLMCVPLVVRGEVRGAISFGVVSPERAYGASELALAQELASQAALAIDNARLYGEARQASQAKSEFMAVMSHELKTPLAAITTYAELLRDGVMGPLTARQAQPLDVIVANSVHLAELIDEVLTYTRTESERLELATERIEVNTLAAELMEWVRPSAAQKGIELVLHTATAPAVVNSDATRLRQVLVNLLTNAVRFTDEGRIEVGVEAAPDRVWIRVADTGIGIASEHQAMIFEPFWQVDRSLTRRVGGAGLGLSIVHRLCRLLGGEVSVQSEVGKGSTFSVWLPAAPA